jgi:hypothetical protein
MHGKHLHYQHFNCGLIQNSGDKVTYPGVGFCALRISIFIRGLPQLVGLMGAKIDINVNR